MNKVVKIKDGKINIKRNSLKKLIIPANKITYKQELGELKQVKPVKI